jgi:glycosyltransferase involved in cell wall biosynthesis
VPDKPFKIAVVVPCYRVSRTVGTVVNGIPPLVDYIIVVDDKCPEGSGEIAHNLGNPRVVVLYNDENQGVGGAVLRGYEKALELGCDVVVKMDGDNQMDPCCLEDLIRPLLLGDADYAKGNRLVDFGALRTMPKRRVLANSVGSFAVKAVSGYWGIMDPANGYTAICAATLKRLPLRRIAKRYFFETDMLVNLRIIGAVVRDVQMAARYGNEVSSFTLRELMLQFPGRLIWGLVRRVLLQYYLYDFNMASLYLLIGLPLFLWGVGFGAFEWGRSVTTGVGRSTGTIMLSVLPMVISFEMLLQAINIDITNVPRK